ncbi:MAG: ABC transporter ATP-binding protein [Nitrospirae bacterium]|nr:ABC transporter ATP-binding protein [Nitrospirota bacterium]MCL5977253.1 ABC transporter ATP-binding protein [Nitrospirota bacterium]
MLELSEISKNFGDVKAVDSVSLSIKEGEMLGLVGPNGSGKSTLLKIMLGITRPSSGKVLFSGKELAEKDWKEIRKKIGYMPERVNFYDNLTGKETIELFAKIKGGDLGNVPGLLKKVGLENAVDRRVGGYSKGMRQRLNLAQALSNDPDFLVLDEPTSGLDPVGTKEFYNILDDVRTRKKLTVILSSHILAEIEDKIDRVAVLKAGALRAVGSLEELYSGFNLPLKISIALKEKNGTLEEILKREGAKEIGYKDGHLTASIQREDKLRLLSAVMEKKESFVDLSIREPNLEEVFFGIH